MVLTAVLAVVVVVASVVVVVERKVECDVVVQLE